MKKKVSIWLPLVGANMAAALWVGLSSATQADVPKGGQIFNGKTLAGWKLQGDPKRSKWVVGQAALDKNPRLLQVAPIDPKPEAPPGDLVNAQGGGINIFSEAKFGDCLIDLEVMVPQGSNSGIYVMGEYEVQVFDSHGKAKLGFGDMGAIYSVSPPRVNATKKPGEWQRFVIEFQAPRFQEGKKISNACFLKVTLNGQVIQENAQMKGPTPGGVSGKEAPTGPLMFQGDHGPVAYRSINVWPLPKKE